MPIKNIRSLVFIVALMACCTFRAAAQAPPSIGEMPDDTIFVNTGENYLLIPGLDDNDSGDQALGLTIDISDTTLLSEVSVSYAPGSSFAVLHLEEHGSTGSVDVTVTVTDADGSDSTSFVVELANYDRYGVIYEVHDLIFWQEVNAFGEKPVYDTILPRTQVNADQIHWDRAPLTVSGDCSSQWCDGHDFSTTLMHGYIIPPVTGLYTFYQTHTNVDHLFISFDDDFDNCSRIIKESDGEDAVGSATGAKDEWKSIEVQLYANQAYAFYSVHWNVHNEDYRLAWEGPGIEKAVIPHENLLYVYDTERPNAPTGLQLDTRGVYDLGVSWNKALDNQGLAYYTLYVDGFPVKKLTSGSTSVTLDELEAGTTYALLVTAMDEMGNESLISNTLVVSTYEMDENPPASPEHTVLTDSSGLALAIAWDASTDGETEVRGYHVYVDDQLYSEALVADTSFIIYGLSPETSYSVYVTAVDAGFNESEPGPGLTARTTEFSVGNNLGVRNGRFTFELEPVASTAGIGINTPHPYKDRMPDPLMRSQFEELKVGVLRLMWDWDLIGSCGSWSAGETHFMGPDIEFSIGDFINMSNNYGAYTAITITVQDDGWFVHDPNSFLYMLEYIAGPADSEWGAKRAAEGYPESLLINSPGLVIEYGNETWGGTSHCSYFGDDYLAYAQWCREMDVLLKSSPYYDPAKIFTAYSGRNPRPEYSYGLDSKLYNGDNGQVDWVALSGYMGGNFDYDPGVDPGDSELEYLQNGVETMLDKVQGLRDSRDKMIAFIDEVKPMWFYEGNFTSTNYFGRYGQALVFTDYMASAMEEGMVLPCIHSLDRGQWKITVPGMDNKRLPLYYMTSLFNSHCKGDILSASVDSKNVIRNGDGNLIDGAPPISGHAYHLKGEYGILLINRDFENEFYMQLDLPDTLTYGAAATRYMITSDHFSSYDTHIDTSEIVLSDSMMVYIPPSGMVLLSFKGTDQAFRSVQLGYVAGDYIRVDSVRIHSPGDLSTITEPGGTLQLEALVYPPYATNATVEWEILDLDSGTTFEEGLVTAPQVDTAVHDTLYVEAVADGKSDKFEVIIQLEPEISNVTPGDVHFNMYPNPTGQQVRIHCLEMDPKSLIVTDTRGSMMTQKLIGMTLTTLDVSGYSPGMYFVSIQSKNGLVYREKLLVK